MKKAQFAFYGIFSLLMVSACACSKGTAKPHSPSPTRSEALPAFSADSAFSNVARQVLFGPRVPRSEAHEACGRWLASELKRYGADTVIEQTADLDGFGPITNFLGRFNVENPDRLLLLAHWDTRPTADEDSNPANHALPIDGANDGASGVGVLLEIARLIGEKAPSVGIDILFVDAEDSGNEGDEDSWARGTQYFVQHMAYGVTEPMPRYALLLDMVGGNDAKFPREMFSDVNARPIVDKIWTLAGENGLGKRFPNRVGGAVNDDHLPLLRSGIPAVDIIETSHPATGSFNPTWHTMLDNIENIDKETLGDVGRLVTLLIYSE
ncbi:MAG: M28 family peptidase [Muribaculaceae bacterium]|nr:M28 family peptidase [Muribaculaceae bacterium]